MDTWDGAYRIPMRVSCFDIQRHRVCFGSPVTFLISICTEYVVTAFVSIKPSA